MRSNETANISSAIRASWGQGEVEYLHTLQKDAVSWFLEPGQETARAFAKSRGNHADEACDQQTENRLRRHPISIASANAEKRKTATSQRVSKSRRPQRPAFRDGVQPRQQILKTLMSSSALHQRGSALRSARLLACTANQNAFLSRKIKHLVHCRPAMERTGPLVPS